MRRVVRPLFSVLLLALLAGCAKKPAPEAPPSPMTETWLMAHTKISADATGERVTIIQPALMQQVRYGDQNATVYTTLTVETAAGDHNGSEQTATERYALVFSMRTGRWGDFTSALDTFGSRHAVTPYTSYIREGVYYENVYVDLSEAWCASASRETSTLLLLGPDSEISIGVPAVYPKALLHSLRRYREQNTTMGGDNAAK